MTNELESYRRENKRLKYLLQDLLDKASANEKVHQKFAQFELQLLASESLTQFIDLLLNEFADQFNIDSISIDLFDPEDISRELLSDSYIAAMSNKLRFHNQLSSIPDVQQLKQVVLCDARKIENRNLFMDVTGIASAARLPLSRHNFVFGSINLGSNDPNRFSQGMATHFVNHLASIISVCIENVLNQEQLRMLSLVDVLTRVKNRRCFNQTLSKEVARAQRLQQPVSCLFIDLDHFKQVNDTYGHQAGDRALKQVASCVQDLLRKTDLLARFGGEEFVVLLPNTDADKALHTAERIRRKVENLMIRSDQMEFTVTTSIGVSTCSNLQTIAIDQLEMVERSLIHHTDNAVYQAKENGRNQVRFQDFGMLAG